MTRAQKDRRNELAKLRYAANPEPFKQRSKIGGAKQRAKNRWAIAARTKIYRSNNVEKRMEYQRKWRAENPDASAAYARKARSKDPEKFNKRTTAWLKANPNRLLYRILHEVHRETMAIRNDMD